MNSSSASRATYEWKSELFKKLDPGMLLTVFRSGDNYGICTLIIADRISSSAVRVVELTPENRQRIIGSDPVDYSVVTLEQFRGEEFHIVDPPSLTNR
ncbi:MAG: hypothetical protein UU22_C0048G0003 [Parcubacteria group bacterium GW2011_GWA2_40_8]|nr:MAG: hypothetical protein UU22_C0048G0003 [Parcubacteria group bacterium GW2011_GWA2_40_8]